MNYFVDMIARPQPYIKYVVRVMRFLEGHDTLASDVFLISQNVGLAFQAGRERARADRAEDRAADMRVASAVHAGAGMAWADVASDLRVRLIGCEANAQNLALRLDQAIAERDAAVAIAADLAIENQALRTRLQ